MVGQERKFLLGVRVVEADTTEVLRVGLAAPKTVEPDGLVTDDAVASITRGRVEAAGIHIGLGTRHEECSCEMQLVEPGEIEVAAVHDINRSRLG